MTDSLEVLLQEIRQCTICQKFLPLGPNPIIQASRNATILIAGQAPGNKVHQTGLPFNDPSGDRLRVWLGVDRETFYDDRNFAIIPMGFCYPGTGSSGDLPPRPECALHWRARLLAQLPNIRLTLAIGQYAIKYHIPGSQRHKTLTETVKHWRTHWPKLLPLPHPSPRNNRWLKQNAWFESEVIPILQHKVVTVLGSVHLSFVGCKFG